MQIGLVDVLREEYGITPGGILGHSAGQLLFWLLPCRSLPGPWSSAAHHLTSMPELQRTCLKGRMRQLRSPATQLQIPSQGLPARSS